MNCESNCKLFLGGSIAENFHYLEIDKYFYWYNHSGDIF